MFRKRKRRALLRPGLPKNKQYFSLWKARREEVAHLVPLGFEILLGVRSRLDFAGHTLSDSDTGIFKRRDLIGIVREQANGLKVQRTQNFHWHIVFAAIGLEPELFIGLDRIESLILQLVGLKLGHQANATAFLLLIDQDSDPALGNHLERHLQLLAAVASKRAEDIASEALGVDTNQRRLGVNVSHNECDSFLATPLA